MKRRGNPAFIRQIADLDAETAGTDMQNAMFEAGIQ